MRTTWGTALLAGLIVLASGTGCQQRQVVKEKPVGDPLFSSKKPVEGRPRLAGGDMRADDEIPLPPPPPDAPRRQLDPSRLASKE